MVLISNKSKKHITSNEYLAHKKRVKPIPQQNSDNKCSKSVHTFHKASKWTSESNFSMNTYDHKIKKKKHLAHIKFSI